MRSGSRNPERQDLVLIERAIRVRDDWRHAAKVFAQHDLIGSEDSIRQVI